MSKISKGVPKRFPSGRKIPKSLRNKLKKEIRKVKK